MKNAPAYLAGASIKIIGWRNIKKFCYEEIA